VPRRSRIDIDAVSRDLPFGIAAVADLRHAGIPPSTIARRVQAGRWVPVLRGVVKLWPGPPDRDQVLAAAATYARPDGVISGSHALRLHGLTRGPAPHGVLVLVGAHHQLRASAPVLVERTERLPEPVLREGHPIAPVERAVLDTSRRLIRRDHVRAVIAEAVQRRRTTVQRLQRELAEGSQRGTALPRQVLVEVEAGVRSVGEGWAFDLHARSGLAAAMWNPRLYLPSGRFLACPDGWFDDVALAWEIDSLEFHLLPEDWDLTLRRRSAMQGEAVIVEHTRPGRLLTEPDAVVAELSAAYRLAASRPRPAIRAVPAC